MEICVAIGLIALLSTCLGYSITSCGNDNKLQVDETRDAILTCSGITHDNMVWKLRHTDGIDSQIGTCTKSNGQCSGNNIYYSLTIDQSSSTSRLVIKQDHRNKIAGTLQCAGQVAGETVNAASCDIRVVYTDYKVVSCSVSVSTTTDWTVSGSCEVDKIYASDGQYSCQWQYLPQVGALREFAGKVELNSFTEGGKDYQRMNCSFTGQPLPTGDGKVMPSYNVKKIDPTDDPTKQYSGQSITLSPAKGPPVLENCPDYIIEGADANCTCLASASDPPAVVTWTTSVSDVVSQRLTLFLPKASKSQDGNSYTCSQYWGGLSTGHLKITVYHINVRYPPPSAPVISGVTSYKEGHSLQLTCTVTGGKPPVTNVTLSCGTQSDGKVTTSSSSGQPGMVSTITISSLTATDHGSTCLCSATWKDRPSLYAATSTVTIAVLGRSGQITKDTTSVTATTVDGPRSSTDSDNNKEDDDNSDDGGEAKLAAIVGGATGGVALVIIVALIIVIVIVWRRRCDPLYAKTSARQEEDDHTYVELNSHPQIMPPAQVTTQQETYENSSAGNERGNSTEPQYENTTANQLKSSPDGLYENTDENKQQRLSDVQYEITGEPEQTSADYGYEFTPNNK